MKLFITVTLLCWFSFSYSQDDYFKNKTASQIVDVIDKVGFVSKKSDNKVLTVAILRLSESAVQQLNISGWYLCNDRQEDVFRVYNIYYKPISRATFNLYCKELSALMICDGTYDQPR